MPLHTYDSSLDPPVSCSFLFQNSDFHLGITFISITLFTYFIFYTCNFILQIFEDLDRMCSNKLQISGRQKMSKREQERKIKAVREQINTLKLRVTKLESCLRTLKEDPDQYFQNLNSENREYINWKKEMLNLKRMRKINHLMKRKRIVVLLPPALVWQTILDFFKQCWGFFIVLPHQYQHGVDYDPLLLHMDTLPLGTTHRTHVLLGAVCPFLHWVAYFPTCLIIHLTSLCLCLFLFMKPGIPAILTHLAHLILLVVPLVLLLHIHPGITLDVVVQIV